MDYFGKPKSGWLKFSGRGIRAAYPTGVAIGMVGSLCFLPIYTTDNHSGEVLYQIRGSDDWLSEKDFNRRCREVPRTVPQPPESTNHQGPLRGPDPYDSRLFPVEGGPREGQSRGNYEVTQRDGRQPQDNPSSGRRGSAYHGDRGAATTLASSTRVADARVASKLASKPTDSVDRPEQTLPAPLSQLSPLARDLVDIGLGKYWESMDFISNNPSILAQNEIDALIAEALTAEKASQSTRSQTCVHQALLLKECTEVGRDNIGPFFRNLAARDSKTKESFIKDVKKVYISIQERAAKGPPQSQEPTSGPQGRRLPLISQPANESVSQNPSTHTQGPKEPTQHQTPVTRGSDGQLYYTDAAGNLLRPASSQRHDRERHRSQSDPTESAGKMAMLSMEERLQNATDTADRRGDQGRPPGRIVSSPPGLLPTVHEDRMTDNRRIVGTSGTEEKLDHRYRIRSDAGGFFGIGRVFALLWHESAGGGGGGAGGRRVRTELSNPIAVTGRFGEEVYSHIRRMIVVKAEHGFCLCLPINTYNGQGVTKPGLSEGDRRAHTIIYMTDTRPFCLPEEERYLTKKSTAVEKASADQRLDPMSRLNFKKVYTIEHNVKVMNVGKVAKDSLPALLGYWRQSLQA